MSKYPPGVTFKKNRAVFQSQIDGKRTEIALRRHGKLIRESDPVSWVWSSWESLKGHSNGTVGWLIKKYQKSDKYDDLADRTKREYQAHANFYLTLETKNKGKFCDLPFDIITPGVLTKLFDTMRDTPTRAKHRKQYLSAVYSWGLARDICKHNPCKGAELPKANKNSAQEQKQYVQDRDYYFALEQAKTLKSYLYPIMILAYCCRARINEVSRREKVNGTCLASGIKESDIKEEGIKIHRAKGSLPEVTLWSDFLREGYQAAITYSAQQDIKSKITRLSNDRYILRNQNGHPIEKEAFTSAWSRLMSTCKRLNPNFNSFTVHELKAKGIDDHINQESGHKSERAKMIYLRKTKRTPSTR